MTGVVAAVALVAWIASHVAIVAGIARRAPWARAVAALVVPPLAPWWAWTLGMRVRALAWVGSLLAYAVVVSVA